MGTEFIANKAKITLNDTFIEELNGKINIYFAELEFLTISSDAEGKGY